MKILSGLGIAAAEHALLPDQLVRLGIRKFCRERLAELPDVRGRDSWIKRIAKTMIESRIAEVPDLVNDQHYEVPISFFEACLGPKLKYSCCFWNPEDDLASAECRSLEATCQHADLSDGQEVLELGCGWGAVTLWIAEQYPNTTITAISNSVSQRLFIEDRAHKKGLNNVRVITKDVNLFKPNRKFDRLVSVEMFEHVRNWEKLLRRMRRWLHKDGAALVHVFCHRDTPYFFESRSKTDWMASEFFSGGLMPSIDLIDWFDEDMTVDCRWTWSGNHYARTAEAWLENLDQKKKECELSLDGISKLSSRRAFQRWRIFFMACAELFAMNEGQEWMVVHHRLKPV